MNGGKLEVRGEVLQERLYEGRKRIRKKGGKKQVGALK